MSFFNNILGTQGLGTKQKIQAGLMAAMPMFQQNRPGGFAGGLGGLLQGIGQARGWASHQLPGAPNVAPMTPQQLPSPVQVPQGPPIQANPGVQAVPQGPPVMANPMQPVSTSMNGVGPSVLPPAPNTMAGITDPSKQAFLQRRMNLGFGGMQPYGGRMMY